MELYKKHRPTQLKQMVGCEDAVAAIEAFLEAKNVPQAIIFTGPSGCGKTTLARILRKKLGCPQENFMEINAADFNGIENIRSIRKRIRFRSLGGKPRIWYLDECHQLSKEAQHAFLKMLEDTPPQCYFFLATTEPTHKMLNTIITRCTPIKVRALNAKEMQNLIERTLESCGCDIASSKVITRLIEAADGSPRKALVLLNKVVQLPLDKQLDAIVKSDTKQQSYALFQLLIRGARWVEVSALLQKITDEPEGTRHMIMACANTALLKSGNKRAYLIMEAFADHWYDCKEIGLTKACYEVCVTK